MQAGRRQETLLDLVYLDQQELALVYMRKCSILWNRGNDNEENKRNRGDAV